MKTRRDFMKVLGGGALGAALLGKGVAASTPDPCEPYAVDIKVSEPEPKSEKPLVLRLAQGPSQWVREGRVQAGHWFVHEYESTECIDLGPEIFARTVSFAGMKAMVFDSEGDNTIGVKPLAVYTDAKSEEFKEVVKRSSMPYPAPVGKLWGQVYNITFAPPTNLTRPMHGTKDDGTVRQVGASTECHVCGKKMSLYVGDKLWYHEDGTMYCCDQGRLSRSDLECEFFCHSTTLRRFATRHLPVDNTGVLANVPLGLRLVNTGRFTYYTPDLYFHHGVWDKP